MTPDTTHRPDEPPGPPVPLRMRPDLVVESLGRDAPQTWVVKDPLTQKFFRLRDQECFLLRLLDGRTSLVELQQAFERTFAPLRLGLEHLHAFLYRLHEFGLVVADAPNQGEMLLQRSRASRRRSLLENLANPLAIRFPGLRAGPIVEWLYARFHGLFAPWVLGLCVLLVMSAACLVVAEFGTVQSRMPAFHEFFALRNALWFAAAIAMAKVLHELGHALTCRHFGGQPLELGAMLLLFTPVLYCDVSDAWRLPRRRERLLVGAAGMLVELVLAAAATWLWWLSEPGLLNAICLRVMFVCSVSTVLFNANPLLRCDGYYLLSDVLDLPNLWQESRSLFRRRALHALLGIPAEDDPTIPRRQHGFLLAYAVLSTLCRWVMVVTMLRFCFELLEPEGLETLAVGLTVVVLAGLIVPPMVGLARMFARPGLRRRIRRGRSVTSFVVFTALLIAIATVPLPHRVSAPMWLEPRDAQPVYVVIPGRLEDAVAAGSPVAAGDVLARLTNADIDLQLKTLDAEVNRLELRLKSLRLMQTDDPSVLPLIPAADKSLEDARQRREQWRTDRERLELRSPVAGTVLPPPATRPSPSRDRLESWQGTPLEPRNRGCFLETGTLVCLVGDPARLEATLLIDQADVPAVRVGQRVRLWVEQGPLTVFEGQIVELAQTRADESPEAVTKRVGLPAQRTVDVSYQARVALDDPPARSRVGMHGHARILVDWEPLGSRVWQWVQRTFPFVVSRSNLAR